MFTATWKKLANFSLWRDYVRLNTARLRTELTNFKGYCTLLSLKPTFFKGTCPLEWKCLLNAELFKRKLRRIPLIKLCENGTRTMLKGRAFKWCIYSNLGLSFCETLPLSSLDSTHFVEITPAISHSSGCIMCLSYELRHLSASKRRRCRRSSRGREGPKLTFKSWSFRINRSELEIQPNQTEFSSDSCKFWW